MKKVILLVAAMAFLAGSVNAGPMSYIGVYTDAAHEACNVMTTPYVQFTVWLWVLPSDDGMLCTEFQLLNPYTAAFVLAATVNPLKSVALGDPLDPTGCSICFQSCQHDWVWLYQIGIVPTAVWDPGFITIGPRPDAGVYQVANCLPGYPEAPLTILNNLAVNRECLIANEDASWGAIKGMYNE